MEARRLDSGEYPARAAATLRASIPAPESVTEAVAEILVQVREKGDRAVLELTARHDTGGTAPPALRVEDEELIAAEHRLSGEVAGGLRQAIENVRRVAEAGVQTAERTIDFEEHQVTLREAPVQRAAVYVPGGRAPYPSTVVMGVVTAAAAGVEEIAVCSPPGRQGEIHPAILAACRLTGTNEVYRMGGAQAIAALAYGTETINPVDVIVGPGNLYVQEAKRQLSGLVGIDSFAGPSDLLILADAATDPHAAALDLLAQAEHGPGTLVVAASPDTEVLNALARHLEPAPETGATAWLVRLSDLEEGVGLAEAFAPEHLELLVPEAEQLAARVTRAGCVFVGGESGTAFGDYIAGSNHTLPTGGTARFASALSARHFRRGFTQVRIRDGSRLARAAAPLARAEGFELHAQSMEARIRENASDS